MACDASVSDDSSELSAKVQHDAGQIRPVTIYLMKPEQDYGYRALFEGRVVVAEPVYTVPVTMAKADALVDGINVVHVGENCEVLKNKYPDLGQCVEEETAEFQYGEIAATATTDADGTASLNIGGAEKYRIRVKSWATAEDAGCFWGGEEMLLSTESEVTIPVLIFCE